MKEKDLLRRDVLSQIAGGVLTMTFSSTILASENFADLPTKKHTQPTRLIDSNHNAVVGLAQTLVDGAGNDLDRAAKIHNWVRDNIQFGIAPAFYDMKASEVLDRQLGYCNTKAMLFCALLRSVDIPTRIRYVALSSQVLRGLFSPGTAFVDHAVAEVFLERKWIALDSYVVDMPLANAARKKLANEGRSVGFGIHLAGNSQWNANSSSFIQALPNTKASGNIRNDWGYFDDNDDFYKHTADANNRLSFLNSVFTRLGKVCKSPPQTPWA